MSKRLPSIKSLETKLKGLASEFVFKRDNNTCQKCGRYVTGKGRQPSHVVPKSRSKLLRYDDQNIKTLCGGDHMWWHASPIDSGKWFRETFPERARYLDKWKTVSLKYIRARWGTTEREWLEGWIKIYEMKIKS